MGGGGSLRRGCRRGSGGARRRSTCRRGPAPDCRSGAPTTRGRRRSCGCSPTTAPTGPTRRAAVAAGRPSARTGRCSTTAGTPSSSIRPSHSIDRSVHLLHLQLPSLGAVTSLYHFDTSTRPSFYPSVYLSTRLSSCYLMISSLFLSVSICPLKHCTSSIYRSILFYLPMLSTSKDQFTFLFVSLCPYHCTYFIPLDTHLFTYLSILSTYLFPIGISIQLPIYPSIYPFIYFIYPSILSICEKGEKLVRFRRIRKCGVLAKTISMELLYKRPGAVFFFFFFLPVACLLVVSQRQPEGPVLKMVCNCFSLRLRKPNGGRGLLLLYFFF